MYKYIAWRDGELLGERLVVLGPRRSASMPSISKRAFSPRAFEVESVADGLGARETVSGGLKIIVLR